MCARDSWRLLGVLRCNMIEQYHKARLSLRYSDGQVSQPTVVVKALCFLSVVRYGCICQDVADYVSPSHRSVAICPNSSTSGDPHGAAAPDVQPPAYLNGFASKLYNTTALHRTTLIATLSLFHRRVVAQSRPV